MDRNQKAFLLLFSAVFLGLPIITLADNIIVTVINNLINIVVWPLFIGLVVITFIYAGIMYLTARGEPGQISKANQAVIWGVIGVFVGLIAFFITNIVMVILGL